MLLLELEEGFPLLVGASLWWNLWNGERRHRAAQQLSHCSQTNSQLGNLSSTFPQSKLGSLKSEALWDTSSVGKLPGRLVVFTSFPHIQGVLASGR